MRINIFLVNIVIVPVILGLMYVIRMRGKLPPLSKASKAAVLIPILPSGDKKVLLSDCQEGRAGY